MDSQVRINDISSLQERNALKKSIENESIMFIDNLKKKVSLLNEKYNDKWKSDKEKYPFIFDPNLDHIRLDHEAVYISVYSAPKSFACFTEDGMPDLYLFYSFIDKQTWFMNHNNRHYPIDKLLEYIKELKEICA